LHEGRNSVAKCIFVDRIVNALSQKPLGAIDFVHFAIATLDEKRGAWSQNYPWLAVAPYLQGVTHGEF
jgi:hypothetical protein